MPVITGYIGHFEFKWKQCCHNLFPEWVCGLPPSFPASNMDGRLLKISYLNSSFICPTSSSLARETEVACLPASGFSTLQAYASSLPLEVISEVFLRSHAASFPSLPGLPPISLP
ncbi:hypothetical protein FNV43_RR19262 [Rhamnella rubrinervis]|uniref:Uncharacterized protein n=1 Tax=Rhamnella rubrinervis TaxID=2594499 RepID=A0A8K0E2A7_9ROSA|nr:hypothetical protein FNV43_RR19262 [Rhamnella rubrinervis]